MDERVKDYLNNDEYQEQLRRAEEFLKQDKAAREDFERRMKDILNEADERGSNATTNSLLEAIHDVNAREEEIISQSGVSQEEFGINIEDILSDRDREEMMQESFLVKSDNGHVEFSQEEWNEILEQAQITPEELEKYENGTMTKSEQNLFDQKKSVLEDILNVRLTQEEEKAFNEALSKSRENGLDDANCEKIKDAYGNLDELFDAKTAEDARAKITETLEKANKEQNVNWDKVADECQKTQKQAAFKDLKEGQDERAKINKLSQEISKSKLSMAKSGFNLAKTNASVVMDAQENPTEAFTEMLNVPTDIMNMFQTISKYKEACAERTKAKLDAANPTKDFTISKEQNIDKAQKQVEEYLDGMRKACRQSGKDLPLQNFNSIDGQHSIEIKNEFVKEGSSAKTTNLYLDGAKMDTKQAADKIMGPIKDELKNQKMKPQMNMNQMLQSQKTAKESVQAAKKAMQAAQKAAKKAAKTAAKAGAKSIPIGGWIYAVVDAIKEIATKYIQKTAQIGRGGLDDKNKLDSEKGGR